MPQLGYDPNTNFNPTGSGNSNPTILGTGLYQAPQFNINGAAFNSPVNSSQQFGNQLGSYLPNTTTPVQAAQAAGPTTTDTQLGLAAKYGQMASGNGPSLAVAQAQAQGAQNLQGAESMLGSARGAGNPAAAQLAAETARTQGAQQVAQNAVQGRTAEELGALSGQGNVLGTVAGQQLGNNQFNAGQANQIGQSNQANTLAANTNLLGTLSQQDLAQLNANVAGQQLGVTQQLGLGQIGQKAYSDAAGNNLKAVGTVTNGAAGIFGSFLAHTNNDAYDIGEASNALSISDNKWEKW